MALIKEEKNLLNMNQEGKDVRYWVVKKQADDLEIQSIAL